eukprot:7971082-Pyramimonas_sp.AAC.1
MSRLGALWSRLGALWGRLGPSPGPLEPPWGPPGPFRKHQDCSKSPPSQEDPTPCHEQGPSS